MGAITGAQVSPDAVIVGTYSALTSRDFFQSDHTPIASFGLVCRGFKSHRSPIAHSETSAFIPPPRGR